MTKRGALLVSLGILTACLAGCAGDDGLVDEESVGSALLPAGGICGNSLQPPLAKWSSPARNRVEALLSGSTYTYTRDGSSYTKSDSSFHPDAPDLPLTLQELADAPLANISRTYTTATPKAWNATLAQLEQMVKYLTDCALAPTATVNLSITDAFAGDGIDNPPLHVTLSGIAGATKLALAPDWAKRALSASERELVSACLASNMNKHAHFVQKSDRKPGYPVIASDSKALYPYLEGAFFGDAFDPSVGLFSCGYAPNRALSALSGRECTRADGRCNGITYVGSCDSVCKERYNGNTTGNPLFISRTTGTGASVEGYSTCQAEPGGRDFMAITTFLRNREGGALVNDYNRILAPSGATLDHGYCDNLDIVSGLSMDAGNNLSALVCKSSPELDVWPESVDLVFAPNTSRTRGSRTFPTPWEGAGNYKLECAPGEAISAWSTYLGHFHSISCTPHNFHGEFCRPVMFPSPLADNRGFTLSHDELPAHHRLECQGNEHVAGVAYGPGTDPAAKGILCCAN
jgi:hypothetical protein